MNREIFSRDLFKKKVFSFNFLAAGECARTIPHSFVNDVYICHWCLHFIIINFFFLSLSHSCCFHKCALSMIETLFYIFDHFTVIHFFLTHITGECFFMLEPCLLFFWRVFTFCNSFSGWSSKKRIAMKLNGQCYCQLIKP